MESNGNYERRFIEPISVRRGPHDDQRRFMWFLVTTNYEKRRLVLSSFSFKWDHQMLREHTHRVTNHLRLLKRPDFFKRHINEIFKRYVIKTRELNYSWNPSWSRRDRNAYARKKCPATVSCHRFSAVRKQCSQKPFPSFQLCHDLRKIDALPRIECLYHIVFSAKFPKDFWDIQVQSSSNKHEENNHDASWCKQMTWFKMSREKKRHHAPPSFRIFTRPRDFSYLAVLWPLQESCVHSVRGPSQSVALDATISVSSVSSVGSKIFKRL